MKRQLENHALSGQPRHVRTRLYAHLNMNRTMGLQLGHAGSRPTYNTVVQPTKTGLRISCYPHPFTDVINIVAPRPMQMIQLKDVQGRVLTVHQFSQPAYDYQLPAAGLPPGIYFLQVDHQTIRLIRSQR